MSKRIALYASESEIENFFELQIRNETVLKPNYNMAPTRHIPAVFSKEGSLVLESLRWGLADETEQAPGASIGLEEVMTGLNKGEFRRCIIPVSGYYKWKEGGNRADFPFFIRMLNEPVMALAAVMKPGSDKRQRDSGRCAFIQTESNALVHPLDPLMPLQLDRPLARKWLNPEVSAADVIEESRNLFLMTDMTVLRVSKKVNDLAQNSPDLIQPLPK